MQTAIADDAQLETAHGQGGILSLLGTILRSWKFRALAVGSGVGYWLLYAVSGGMLFYYPSDISSLLNSSQTPNPYFLNDFSTLLGSYNSGIVWYPNGHLQINLLYGPLISSLVLSALFSLNFVLTTYGILSTRLSRQAGPLGIVALVPALFSGGCCSVPLGLAFVGLLVPGVFTPSLGVAAFVYDYPYVINIVFGIVMLLSLIYAGTRLARPRGCSPLGGKQSQDGK